MVFISRSKYFSLLTALIFFLTTGVCAQTAGQKTPKNFKIAFIGDQGYSDSSRAVLKLIKSEGANAVVHAGDFDYKHDPKKWDADINAILGKKFPYFASIGNHDVKKWHGADGYQEVIEERFKRLKISWDGDLGVKSAFHYKNIYFIMVGPGIMGEDHAEYIDDLLDEDTSIWRICCWHKNQTRMQVGGKKDETGWEVYEEAREGGAIIATGHEHSYSRTHLLSNMESRTIASTSDTLEIRRGRTFGVVSGLGGKSIRAQKQKGNWWASIYTADQGANFGALFGIFNRNGEANMAEFYFKDITGKVVDRFWVRSKVGN